jgi:transcriptional regulator
VHAHGSLRTIDDPQWLRAFVTRLTDLQERGFASPWRVTDAPEAFVSSMVNGIIGLEIRVRRLEGKWKLGQNRSEADRAGVIRGLRARGDADSLAVANEMAALRGGSAE